MGQITAAFKLRKGLKDSLKEVKEMSYTEVLSRTEVEPVILFENTNKVAIHKILKSESDVHVGDVVKQIYSRILKKDDQRRRE